MRWSINRALGIVLAAFVLAAVLAGSGLAATAAPQYGYYDGAPTNNDGNTISLALEFAVARGAHEVRRLDVSYLEFTCHGNMGVSAVLPSGNTASIAREERFSAKLPANDGYSPQRRIGTVELSGVFGADGTVTGKLLFSGSGQYNGCNRTILWKGQVRPLVDEFTGSVTQGSATAPISFYTTIAPHRHVTDFSVGALTAGCPGGTPQQVKLESVSSLSVRPNATFGKNLFFTSGDAGYIGGEFQNAANATGTISYVGRDDCSYKLNWTAHRVAKSILGPFNFAP